MNIDYDVKSNKLNIVSVYNHIIITNISISKIINQDVQSMKIQTDYFQHKWILKRKTELTEKNWK